MKYWTRSIKASKYPLTVPVLDLHKQLYSGSGLTLLFVKRRGKVKLNYFFWDASYLAKLVTEISSAKTWNIGDISAGTGSLIFLINCVTAHLCKRMGFTKLQCICTHTRTSTQHLLMIQSRSRVIQILDCLTCDWLPFWGTYFREKSMSTEKHSILKRQKFPYLWKCVLAADLTYDTRFNTFH